jgi:hypothetical protein
MSGIVPLRRSAIWRPLPSTGSQRVGSPASPVLWDAPIPCRPSRRTSLPSLGGTDLRSLVRSRRRLNAAAAGQGFSLPGYPSIRVSRGGGRASQVPGEPIVYMPCSLTPAGPLRQAISALRCCLPPFLRRRLPRRESFGAQSHGLHTRCLRFVTTVSRGHARLASGCWPALPGGIGYPLGSYAEFQSFLHLILPAQASSWRTRTSS